jgi:hypothetical protein
MFTGKILPFTDRNEVLLFRAYPLIRRFDLIHAAQLSQQTFSALYRMSLLYEPQVASNNQRLCGCQLYKETRKSLKVSPQDSIKVGANGFGRLGLCVIGAADIATTDDLWDNTPFALSLAQFAGGLFYGHDQQHRRILR